MDKTNNQLQENDIIPQFDLSAADEIILGIVDSSIANEIADGRQKYFLSKDFFLDYEENETTNGNGWNKIQIEIETELKLLDLRKKIGQMVKRTSLTGASWIRIFKWPDSDTISIAVPYQVIWKKNIDTEIMEEAMVLYYQTFGNTKFIKIEKWTLNFVEITFSETDEDGNEKISTPEQMTKKFGMNFNSSQINELGFVPVVELLNHDTEDNGGSYLRDLYNTELEMNEYALSQMKLGYYLAYYNPQVFGRVSGGEGQQGQDKILSMRNAVKQIFRNEQYAYGTINNLVNNDSIQFLDVNLNQIQIALDTAKTLKHQIFEIANATTDIDGGGKAQKNDQAIRNNRQGLELYIENMESKLNETGTKIIKMIQKQVTWIPNDLNIIFIINSFNNRNEIAERTQLLNEYKEMKDLVGYLKQKNNIPEFQAKIEAKNMIDNIEKFKLTAVEDNNKKLIGQTINTKGMDEKEELNKELNLSEKVDK